MENRDVTPDDSLLKQIFTTNEPANISIILNDWDKCVFKAEFSRSFKDNYSACIVRIEAENESSATFSTIAALQKIAETVIPELIPRIFQVGKATNKDGRIFHFSVIELMEGDTLNDVWHHLSAEDKTSVVIEIVEALRKLHLIRLKDEKVQTILSEMLRGEGDKGLKSFDQPGVFGGPHTGFLDNGPALLDSIMKRRKLTKPFCSIEPLDSGAIKIQSKFEDLGSIIIKNSDMSKWPEDSVFCHNDLTPRNIILKLHTSANGESKYKLGAIIDWELAGFYPASYELSLQDTYLSGGTRQVSFYLLLKKHMYNLVPQTPSQIALLLGNELVFESQQRHLSNGTNIPANIRKIFIHNSGLEKDNDPYVGWRRIPNQEHVPDYSTAEAQKLEDEVVEDMIARRNSKAN